MCNRGRAGRGQCRRESGSDRTTDKEGNGRRVFWREKEGGAQKRRRNWSKGKWRGLNGEVIEGGIQGGRGRGVEEGTLSEGVREIWMDSHPDDIMNATANITENWWTAGPIRVDASRWAARGTLHTGREKHFQADDQGCTATQMKCVCISSHIVTCQGNPWSKYNLMGLICSPITSGNLPHAHQVCFVMVPCNREPFHPFDMSEVSIKWQQKQLYLERCWTQPRMMARWTCQSEVVGRTISSARLVIATKLARRGRVPLGCCLSGHNAGQRENFGQNASLCGSQESNLVCHHWHLACQTLRSAHLWDPTQALMMIMMTLKFVRRLNPMGWQIRFSAYAMSAASPRTRGGEVGKRARVTEGKGVEKTREGRGVECLTFCRGGRAWNRKVRRHPHTGKSRM
jgi:hypothetical protein